MWQGIAVRKATEADLDAVERLYEKVCDYLEAHQNFPGWKKGIYPVRQTAEKGLAAGGLCVARLQGKTAGTMILRHEPEEGFKNARWLAEDDYRRIYVVYTLAVHPDFLNRGVAAALLQFAEQLAREEGCVSLRLDVVKGNLPAERLYQKCGYQLVGTVSLGCERYGLPWFHLYEKLL